MEFIKILQIIQILLSCVLIPICSILFKLYREILEFKLEVAHNYVKKDDCGICKQENKNTHKTIFDRVESLKNGTFKHSRS
jgi:hypothetical protein